MRRRAYIVGKDIFLQIEQKSVYTRVFIRCTATLKPSRTGNLHSFRLPSLYELMESISVSVEKAVILSQFPCHTVVTREN
jgi:hypothetical protein